MSPPDPAELVALPRNTSGARPGGRRHARGRHEDVRVLSRSGLPRVLPKHLGPEADAIREYLGGLLDRAGLTPPLPRAILSPLREAGLAFVDLRRLRADLESLRARRGGGVRKKEERKLRGEIRKTRIQVLLQEREVQRIAKTARPTLSLAERLAARGGRT